MDTLENLRAFLQAARLGSFSAAARHAGTTPSVIAKRIDQIEHRLGHALFRRSTRRLELTEEGTRLLPRCTRFLAEFDDMAGKRDVPQGYAGRLQVRLAGPVVPLLLAPAFGAFLAEHPRLELDCRQVDRLVNPLEDGCDVAIGMRTASFPGVAEVPLAAYPRVACASPAYLARQGTPRHPHELALHACVVSSSTGPHWRFWGEAGEVTVEVDARLLSNSSVVQRAGALAGVGVAILPAASVAADLREGRLVELFDRYRPLQMWLKALVPAGKRDLPVIDALLFCATEALRRALPFASPVPPEPSTQLLS